MVQVWALEVGTNQLLGFSLTKILFTIVMIFAVLWVYRQFNRLTEGDGTSRRKSGKSSHAEAASPSPPDVEDLSACPACGAYVAAGSNPGCGRAAKNCPMHR